MSPEQVRDFVAAEFGIGETGDKNRVFEISARRAFTSANFLMELKQSSDVEVGDLKTVRALAQEVFGIDWEEELEDTTVGELQRKADKLWKKSNFEPFLNDAINALMREAAPRCMSSALNIAKTHLIELQNEVKLRYSAVDKDAQKITNEIEFLNEDLSQLNKFWEQLGEAEILRPHTGAFFHAASYAAQAFVPTLRHWLVDFFIKQGLKQTSNSIFDLEPIESFLKKAVHPDTMRNNIELWVTIFPEGVTIQPQTLRI